MASSTASVEAVSSSASRLDTALSHLLCEDVQCASRGAEQGLMDLAHLEVPLDAHVFMCGTLPFMRQARRVLIDKGVSPESIRYEVFGPDSWAQDPDSVAA